MGLMNKFNKGNAFKDIDTSNMDYVSLADVYDEKNPEKVFKIQGVYINPKSKLGASCVAIGEDVQYNLPQHQVENIQQMLDDEEVINAIRNGHVGFKITPYENSFSVNKQTGEITEFYGIDWVDVD